jgi:hypothetical protein
MSSFGSCGLCILEGDAYGLEVTGFNYTEPAINIGLRFAKYNPTFVIHEYKIKHFGNNHFRAEY